MAKKSDIISQAEFARRVGVTQSAVHNAVKTKRITLRPDGKLNYPIAIAEWRANTDVSKRKLKFADESKPVKLKSSKLDAAALTRIKELLQSEGFDVSDGLNPELVRIAEGVARANERMFRLDVEKRKYILTAAIGELNQRIAIGWRRAIENFPARISAELAAKLRCDEHALREARSDEGQHRMKQTFRDQMIEEIRRANPKKCESWLKQQIEHLDAMLKGLNSDENG
jgi:hypothetical protein